MDEIGIVTTSQGYLLHLDGLPSARINDLVENEEGVRGWVNAVYPDRVEVFVVDEAAVKPGQVFKKTNKSLTVTAGQFLLSRAVNPLGVPIDGKGPFPKNTLAKNIKLDSPAPDISKREIIKEQFYTGISATDTIIPLGKGQRELIIGDARSGKSGFLISLISNQKNKNIICIYASIGKPMLSIRNIIDTLSINKALKYTVIVAAASTDPAPLIYLTPQTAFAIAEYFQSQGYDCLVILDDMGNHAKIYREMALLGNKIPGRESYPGDMFYQHAHLFEKAGNFSKAVGGGSITAIPVIEINLTDFTTLIPTNLMAMTDGHLLFRSSLYNQGQIPAIDLSLSVSRVGLQTQSIIQKILASKIKVVLTQAEQFKTLKSFGGEVTKQTQMLQKQGQILNELLRQETLTNIEKETQVALLFLAFTNYLLEKEISFTVKNKKLIINALQTTPQLTTSSKTLYNSIDENQALPILNSIVQALEGVIK